MSQNTNNYVEVSCKGTCTRVNIEEMYPHDAINGLYSGLIASGYEQVHVLTIMKQFVESRLTSLKSSLQLYESRKDTNQ